ncbi:MAG TPA: glycosyltransferase family 1 protein [Propionibacteriaceae bacterium]|nr:glycosyltransferase family 1 protein [Propionibacteriaceae bacterium]
MHGGYTDTLLGGPHTYLFPARDAAGRGGLGRLDGRTPANAIELSWPQMRAEPPDLVVLQQESDVQDCAVHLGRRPGRELPAVWLEHNTPRLRVPDAWHPMAEVPGVMVVHVTHFNALLWDCGAAPTMVVEHGVPDLGHRYTGEQARLAYVVNEPVRRWRVTGTDLLPVFADHPVDAFGIDAELLPAKLGDQCPQLRFAGNLAPEELYAEMAQRRAYLHLNRWTSLGLSLLQAMVLGMPVLVLDTTEASRAVPPEAGALSCDLSALRRTAAGLLADIDEARARGAVARQAVLERYPLDRFLAGWDEAFLRAQELIG